MSARAITLHQPYASLVAVGAKTIIDRDQPTDWRGELLIHASTRRPTGRRRADVVVGGWRCVHWDPRRLYPPEQGEGYSIPYGAVVASCRLADCVPIVGAGDTTSDPAVIVGLYHGKPGAVLWRGGQETWINDQVPFGDFTAPAEETLDRQPRYAWLLEDCKALDPIPCKGRPGLWTPTWETT